MGDLSMFSHLMILSPTLALFLIILREGSSLRSAPISDVISVIQPMATLSLALQGEDKVEPAAGFSLLVISTNKSFPMPAGTS